MSLLAPNPPTSNQKPNALEIPLVDLPPGFDAASNGGGSTLKPPSISPKLSASNLQDPEFFRRLSLSTISGLSDDGRGRPDSQIPHSRYASRSPAPPTTWKASWQRFWQRNRGLWLVTMAQFFGALMAVCSRVLELDEHGLSPFQLLFVRMGLTSLAVTMYMWYTGLPYAPFGMREVRVLLFLRGFSGFFGLFGTYYSLQYMPMADVTVITFLAPSVAGFACYMFVGERFTRTEQIASVISLLGVVMIARPTSFFHLSSAGGPVPSDTTYNSTNPDDAYQYPTPTSAQRLSAVGVSLVGVLGIAGVFTTIRWMGKRAAPLISVNYFATWCTIVSFSALSISSFSPPESSFYSPAAGFALPHSLRQWALLAIVMVSGLITQVMFTAGLSHEKSNRATNMVYTNMLFALMFDRLIFGTVPTTWSLVGSALILGSAIYVAMHKDSGDKEGTGRGGEERDEERAMLRDAEGITIEIEDTDTSERSDNEHQDVRH